MGKKKKTCRSLLDLTTFDLIAITAIILVIFACAMYLLEYLGVTPMLGLSQGNFWDNNPNHWLIAFIIALGAIIFLSLYTVKYLINRQRKKCMNDEQYPTSASD